MNICYPNIKNNVQIAESVPFIPTPEKAFKLSLSEDILVILVFIF